VIKFGHAKAILMHSFSGILRVFRTSRVIRFVECCTF